MLRFALSFVIALVALVLAPVASLAGPPLNVVSHAAALQSIAPDQGGFSVLHNNTGAGAENDVTLPDCRADVAVGNQISRGNIGAAFVIAATAYILNVLVFDETNSLFVLNGTALDAGDEVALSPGDVAIFICTMADRWVVEGAGGLDGGAA